MSKKFVVSVTVPEGLVAGDTFEVEVEAPAKVKGQRGQRGQLAGIPIEEMTDEQLKREIINAGSVLYKAKQRGAKQETIDTCQVRVDAAKAEREKRKPVTVAATAAEIEGGEEVSAEESVYSEETAAEM